jgi:hypothetical protein
MRVNYGGALRSTAQSEAGGDEFRSDGGDEEFGCKEGISQLFILEEHLYEQL